MKSEEINRWIGNRFYEHEHPFRRGGAGMEDFAKLIPFLKASDASLVVECAAKIEKLLDNTAACSSCTAKIYVYLSIIYKEISKKKSNHYTKMMYQTLQREERNYKSEVYGTMLEQADLLSAEEMRLFLKKRMPHTKIPHDFYCITDVPAPLAGMCKPDGNTDWKGMARAGFKYVMNLVRDSAPPYDPSPLKFLCDSVELDNLNSDYQDPMDPEEEEKIIKRIVNTTIQKLDAKEGVVVHCWGGRGRTGTVLGCILKKIGYDSGMIKEYLRKLNVQRGNGGWPESPWQSWLLERS